MQEVTVIIPNLNGKTFIRDCLDSLREQREKNFKVIVVDNGSTDESPQIIEREYPEVFLIRLNQNYGFCRAVNEGIKASDTEFVLLLNNDTKVETDFVTELILPMKQKKEIFSCQAKMLQMDCPDKMDDAGNYYCALGWASARGKGRPAEEYTRPVKIFSACAGAAAYRREVFEKIGYFDEAHFAYLEDVDIGYRARIAGYENWYVPNAVVYHKGSGTSGSRYNKFKVFHSARNNLYLIYKNMSRWQILINLPFLAAGILIKLAFFTLKGFGPTYLNGLWKGVLLARKGKKVPFLAENFDNCCRIQIELWGNLGRILRKNK